MKPLRFRAATRTERQLAMLWGAAAVSAVALRPVWIAIAPHLGSCTFRRLTGIPCPTCGTTRTALALLDLDLGAAIAVNPLATLVGVVFIVGGWAALVWVLLRGPVPVSGLHWSRLWTAATIGLVLINWIYLIVTG
jgi:hypothetical protein